MNVKQIAVRVLLVLFILVLIVGLAGMISLNRTFRAQEIITFSDPAGDELLGTYQAGSQPLGVLLLEGFGSDQIALRPAASLFQQAGAHLFSFDFSGHGRSPGTLGFDNAATDRLARQVMAAKEVFKSVSGLEESQMVYFGHSLGARVALQAASLDSTPPDTLVLLGTQVNLGSNRQSEFFTGTQDTELDWVNALSAEKPAAHILLLSGSWDDILTPEAAHLLFDKLSTEEGPAKRSFTRQVTIIPALLHNYEIYSTRLFNRMDSQLNELGQFSLPRPLSLSQYYFFGSFVLVGLIGALITAPVVLKASAPSVQPTRIIHLGRFLRGKLLLWLAAIPVGALLTSAFFFLPLGLPVLNLYYVAFLGGYGLLLLVLYLTGRMPGTEGRWPLKKDSSLKDTPVVPAQTFVGLGIWVLILLTCVLFTRAGLFFVIPANQRLIWLAILSPVTALGFWIGGRETHMLGIFRHESGQKLRWAPLMLGLIGLTPFFIYTIFMAVLGSLSGMVGSLQGLLILFLTLLTGKLLQHFIPQGSVVALLQAALLYALIMPQNVLFAF